MLYNTARSTVVLVNICVMNQKGNLLFFLVSPCKMDEFGIFHFVKKSEN